jgi:hypothetical protein
MEEPPWSIELGQIDRVLRVIHKVLKDLIGESAGSRTRVSGSATAWKVTMSRRRIEQRLESSADSLDQPRPNAAASLSGRGSPRALSLNRRAGSISGSPRVPLPPHLPVNTPELISPR